MRNKGPAHPLRRRRRRRDGRQPRPAIGQRTRYSYIEFCKRPTGQVHDV